MPLHIVTPLLESLSFGERSARSVWLKMDAMQPSGSFKMRGVGHACEWHARHGARGFVSSSGGNAGLAVACAGRALGLPVTVVVPQTTSARARALIAQQGAEVVVHGSNWNEANALAQSRVSTDRAFVHPFDDALLWQGHSSLVDEVAASGLRPEAVVLSVGGGGLLCGMVEGLQRQGWGDVPVLAVETAGADSLARAWQAGRPLALEAITSIATSLGARQVCEAAYRVRERHPVHSVVVSDAQAVEACLALADEHRVIVEPACGSALAALSVPAGREALGAARQVLVVVCGGVGASHEQLRQWHTTFGGTA